MFTNEQVNLVVGETFVSTNIVMATMFDFEARDNKLTVADVIAAVLESDEEGPAGERSSLLFKIRSQPGADHLPPE